MQSNNNTIGSKNQVYDKPLPQIVQNHILVDVRGNGKKKKNLPWQVKKVRSLVLADSYKRLGELHKASRVRFCGQQLTFAVNKVTGEKRLHDANFCRERLCPMCAWRRSLKIYHQVSQVMDEVVLRYKTLQPIFLTLTVQNVSADLLGDTITAIFAGWNRMFCNKRVKRIVRGWFRALEVTYNKIGDTFHPHIHAVLMVKKSYFLGSDYLSTEDWVKLWRVSARLDYNPIVDVRKIKGKRSKAVAEVAKYSVKDTDYIFSDNPELTDHVVSVLSVALKNRRLYAFGGILKDVAKELDAENVGEGDLIHVDDADRMRGDVAEMIITYRWNMGLGNYVYYDDEVKGDKNE